METLLELQLLRTSLTKTDNFRNSRKHGKGKECSKAMTSSPKNHLYFETMIFLISKLIHVFTCIFPINSSRNIDYVGTAVLIPFSDFMTEMIVLGLNKNALFWFSSVFKGIYSLQVWYFFQKYMFEFPEAFCFRSVSLQGS